MEEYGFKQDLTKTYCFRFTRKCESVAVFLILPLLQLSVITIYFPIIALQLLWFVGALALIIAGGYPFVMIGNCPEEIGVFQNIQGRGLAVFIPLFFIIPMRYYLDLFAAMLFFLVCWIVLVSGILNKSRWNHLTQGDDSQDE